MGSICFKDRTKFGFNGGGISVGNDTPDLDAYAAKGLILTSAFSQPSSSPTRATIMTGQYPVHHGILRPPMHGEPGGLQDATTIAKLLSDQGYVTQAIGKWHMGENEESLPQNVGFDDFRGFCSVSDMYTEWRDPNFNPEVALSPDRYEYIKNLPFSKADVHAVKGGKLEEIADITPKYMEDLDQRWMEYGPGRRLRRHPPHSAGRAAERGTGDVFGKPMPAARGSAGRSTMGRNWMYSTPASHRKS